MTDIFDYVLSKAYNSVMFQTSRFSNNGPVRMRIVTVPHMRSENSRFNELYRKEHQRRLDQRICFVRGKSSSIIRNHKTDTFKLEMKTKSKY